MMKIRKGDEVYILTGKDKGKRGKILQVMPTSEKVLVEGVNMVKRHTKPNPTTGAPGSIVEKEAPVHRSNVALFNPNTSKPDRVSVKTREDGRKVRVFKSNYEVVDV